MKSSRAEQAADRQLGAERADRGDRQHPVAALLDQRRAGWRRGRSRGGGRRASPPPWRCTIAAPCSAAAAAISSPPGPERVAAEDHRQPSHRADPTPAVEAQSSARYGETMARPAVRTRGERGRTPRPQPRRAAAGAAGRAARRPGALRLPAGGPVPAELHQDHRPSRRGVYFATLLCTAISAVLLISPSAYHRLTFRYQQKRQLIFLANRFAIAGLGFLALAMTGAIVLITEVLFGTAATAVTGGLALSCSRCFWYAAAAASPAQAAGRGAAARDRPEALELGRQRVEEGQLGRLARSISRSASQTSSFSSSGTLSSSLDRLALLGVGAAQGARRWSACRPRRSPARRRRPRRPGAGARPCGRGRTRSTRRRSARRPVRRRGAEAPAHSSTAISLSSTTSCSSAAASTSSP